MRNDLSFGKILGAFVIVTLLCAPQAFAQFSDYSTDMEEPDIMTVKNDHCCDNARLKQEANLQIRVDHALFTTFKPVKIQVFNAYHQMAAEFSTRNRIIYMHLPEGRYTIKVNGLLDHRSLDVETSDAVLKNYTM